MIAIFAFTKPAVKLGIEILKYYDDADLYVTERNCYLNEKCKPIIGNFHKFFEQKWNNYSCFIMIMSTGIVVRSVKDLIKSKLVDPAVLVVDQKGKYVIPMLSGHLGGANEFAIKLAGKINAVPIITTASDVQGIPALDDIARKNDCIIENICALKDISSFILENKNVALYTSVKIDVDFPGNMHFYQDLNDKNLLKYSAVVYITEQMINHFINKTKPYIILRPKNIIVGIGCKRNKSKSEILEAIREHMEQNSISMKSIRSLATIEIKKDEEGLVEAARELNVPLKWYTVEDIKKIENNFQLSKFVKKTVGVGAVCEPSAWLSAQKPKLISNKTSYNGITLAIVKDLINNGDGSQCS